MSAHNQAPLEPIKRYLVKGIASGIGLASESITSYREHKKLRGSPEQDLSAPAQLPSDENTHNELWILDEQQDAHSPPPSHPAEHRQAGSDESETEVETASPSPADEFLRNYAAPSVPDGTSVGRLPRPVILPQKRPKTRSRGFIRAYAPCLEGCGISQDMFLDFLKAFDSSTQASPWLDVLNLAGWGLAFAPHFPIVVGIAVQLSIMAAKDIQNRTRTNSFLDKANAQFFMPKGLYCLVMTYSPEDATQNPRPALDLSSIIASRLQSKGLQKFQNRLREASGQTTEAELPESAPLVFPGLERNRIATDQTTTAMEKMKLAQKYITTYYDKRAQARFAGKHVDSGLAKGPKPAFTSRYADPNHPAASGSFRSLVTGGNIKPPEMGRNFDALSRGDRATRRERYKQGLYEFYRSDPRGTAEHRWDDATAGGGRSSCIQPRISRPAPLFSSGASPGRMATGEKRDVLRLGPLALPSPGTVVKKAFGKNILYMMVVNMPTDEELSLAAEHIAETRSEGFRISDFFVKRNRP
ncbi:hypothetical protein AAL_03550 [Moelleriella libera RCEF 2490]|uniref:FAD binding domain protein n=1 Tax=Moelleriella libera RCEF 2490 TaxID=1081109 RepID=A0A168DC13_9HYPO|nr:hypothetical protein AAL_03550 [Moelleriella libera RCEF 2490]